MPLRATFGRVFGTGPVPSIDRSSSVDGLRCVSATLAIIQIAGAGDRNATSNALDLLGKALYSFSYEDVTEEPGYVVGTVRSALDATSRAAS
jgi:hypothetical protein